MSINTPKLVALVGIGIILSACETVDVVQESSSLIGLNKDFVALVDQLEKAEELLDQQQLDNEGYSYATEGIRSELQENGSKAEEEYAKTTRPRMQASFISVAVRSFLKSGYDKNSKVLALADTGKGICENSGLRGSDGLPTTCGYFYAAQWQAYSNSALRDLKQVLRAVEKVVADADALLPMSYGKKLEKVFDDFVYALQKLTEEERLIIVPEADGLLTTFFYRQQDIFFCNARRALRNLAYVGVDDVGVSSNDDWDLKKVSKRLSKVDKEESKKLANRGVKFPRDTCLKLGSALNF